MMLDHLHGCFGGAAEECVAGFYFDVEDGLGPLFDKAAGFIEGGDGDAFGEAEALDFGKGPLPRKQSELGV